MGSSPGIGSSLSVAFSGVVVDESGEVTVGVEGNMGQNVEGEVGGAPLACESEDKRVSCDELERPMKVNCRMEIPIEFIGVALVADARPGNIVDNIEIVVADRRPAAGRSIFYNNMLGEGAVDIFSVTRIYLMKRAWLFNVH